MHVIFLLNQYLNIKIFFSKGTMHGRAHRENITLTSSTRGVTLEV